MTQQFGIPYPQFLVDDSVMQQFFGSDEEAALPSTFVFDQDGRLRRLFRGAVTEADFDSLLLSFRDEGASEANVRFLGQTYFDAGDYDRAVEYYRRLAALEPVSTNQIGMAWERRRVMDRFNLGRARFRSGRPAEAVDDFQAALEFLGEDHDVLLQLGIAAAQSGQFAVAVDALERVVQVTADSEAAWLTKARVHRARGEIAAARDSYEKALQLDPSNTPARQELAGLGTAASPR